jgi:hypothetical protein
MSTHHWILLDAGGAEIRASEGFASKEEAEAWMGTEWSALLDEGAESVALVEGDRRIYEMSLREA